ncbi:bifunctional transcriptional activator/DNA repair enzyme AdaA [Kordiimonas pumila]|uniref:Bifunctional transcriptional activator/DNA repair enzyme AdaA n=1 Tax=Kordiimonas pumila TaxID=2161677 RepID=A0ABV7D7Q2_9PROT|nr:Ada metal-binding domain-containing protein [Kordiimonas pumila]
MKETHNILYEALLNRDPTFDGRLFFAVVTTGIYCRPVCPAPKPKPQNVLYFPKADAAQKAGFRPCKRCRPEAREGSPAWKGTQATLERALRILATPLSDKSIEQVADSLGITDRHLRRLFQHYLGKSPLDVRQEQRLQLALTLLTDKKSRITDIAYSSGFSSLRRFNAAFKIAYGLSPSNWRKEHA